MYLDHDLEPRPSKQPPPPSRILLLLFELILEVTFFGSFFNPITLRGPDATSHCALS